MRSWKLRDRARTVRLSRVLTAAAAVALMLSFVTGCGPSRPDPLAVVKDGGDDEEEKPKPRAARQPAAGQAPAGGQPAAPAGGAAAGDPPAAGPSGTAPFDLSFLPVDTELVLVAQCGDIIRSSLVQTVTAGDLAALDPFVDGFGQRFLGIESLRIGIRNLKDVPAPTKEALAQGLGGFSLKDLALNPDISSTIVIQTRERVDETPLRKNGEEIRIGDKRYFRLKSNTFQSACACIQGFRTLIISDEPTILSIVEAKGPPPKPQATFSFAREADLVIAVSPKDSSQMQRWLPTLDLLAPQTPDEAAAATAAVPGVPAAGESAPSVADGQAVAASETETATSGGQVAAIADATATQAAAEQPADRAGAPPIPGHVTGAALMINLAEGVAVSVALNCDSPESAEAVEAELQKLTAQVQSEAAEQNALAGGIRALIDSLVTTRLQTVAALTTAVAADRQTDVMTLPALLLGDGAATEAGAAVTAGAPATGEPSGAFAEQILREGVPPLAAEQMLPGMEIRGLARWQPEPAGGEGPRQLELGVVAFGGPATTAVAAGHFQLHEAEVNRLSPLKWVGTSPAYAAQGLNPIDGLVPVRHDGEASVHPKNGVLAVFAVVPPSEPATHLRRFRGRFVMRYFTISEEVVVENLRAAIRAQDFPQELRQAGVEFDLSRLAAQETLELLAPETTNIGAVRLLAADGTPIGEVTATTTSSQGRVLRTLSTGGVLPEDVALSVTLNSELAEVEIPFEFANLPIPDVGALSDLQRAQLVWTVADADSGLPEGLLVEAQARWDNPHTAAGLVPSPSHSPRTPARRHVLSDSDDDDDRRRDLAGAGRAHQSDRPLRILVDLTGPLVEEADALGAAQVTSIETDLRTELNFEGAYFQQEDATGEAVTLGRSTRGAGDGPPGGMRVAFHFTPPLQPIHELARFNGSVRLKLSQNRTESLIPDLHERVDRRLTNRELTGLGLALVARIDDGQILVRVLEGADEQISDIVAVDTFGDPVPGVVVTRQEASPQAGGRRVHVLAFARGVPTGLGLQVVANSSVRTVDVPFRFTKLPVPPAPGLPGL